MLYEVITKYQLITFFSILAVSAILVIFRITSYNVCYTKLLRSRAAPVFVHGDGVGASGCVMIAPPVYLSEEDALNIIFTELKKEGLSFKDEYKGDSIKIVREKIDYNYDENISNWEDRYVKSKETKNLYPDAYNKELNLIIVITSYSIHYTKLYDSISFLQQYNLGIVEVRFLTGMAK